jgi:hypothetical protein
MRKAAFLLICVLIAATALTAAQVPETANARRLSVTAGVFASGFQPHHVASIGDSGDNFIFGAGTYVDVHFTHWFQLEGEARWLRFNEYFDEHQDNYLIGPKIPIHQFGRANVYGKVLVGLGMMTFPRFSQYDYGRGLALAYGGGVDYKLTRRLSFRAVDFEYQQWPTMLPNNQLYPYGVSMGLGYKVF